MTSVADLELSVAVPRQWRTHADPDRGIALVARSVQVPASGLAPELVLRSVAPDDTALPAGVEVEDSDEFDLDGCRVHYERLAHRVGTTEVISERWTWLVADGAVTLTGSVARADYEDYCDLFEEVAATVSFSAGGSPGPAHPDGGRW